MLGIEPVGVNRLLRKHPEERTIVPLPRRLAADTTDQNRHYRAVESLRSLIPDRLEPALPQSPV